MLIYALTDPRSGEVVYVGQTSRSLAIRHREHLIMAMTTEVSKWVFKLLDEGLIPGAVTLETGEWGTDDLNDRERYWVEKLSGEGSQLLNGLPGGEDCAGAHKVVYRCAECDAMSANGVFTLHRRETGHRGKVVHRSR